MTPTPTTLPPPTDPDPNHAATVPSPPPLPEAWSDDPLVAGESDDDGDQYPEEP